MTFICASHRDGSSPHTRGARLRLVTHPGRRIIIPAYAGSTVHPGRWSPAPADHPRIRGEHGDRRRVSLGRQVSSPHTRGARIHAAARRWPSDHPRIRGEHRQEGRRQGLVWGSSPHTRGARHPGEVCPKRPGIIPAYAGSTSRRPRRTDGRGDHPRIRGEHVDPLGAFVDLQDHSRIRGEHSGYRRLVSSPMGSSPHTRGAPDCGQARQFGDGIIPAYAGSTGSMTVSWSSRMDHPRIRGEHRGVGANRQPRGWIIPAYAGSTSRRDRHGRLPSDHPRIRGEHPFLVGRACGPPGSSPHTRGARVARIRPRMRARIIPAYAGSTAP